MNKLDFERMPEKERMNRVLTGKSFFASVHSPNTSAVKKFKGQPKFSIKLGLDEKNVKLAESYGLKVKQADDIIPLPYVEIKRVVRDGKTPDQVKPEVVDSMQKPVPANVLIGNGSDVAVKFGTRWYDNLGGGVSTTLWKVQIKKLVPFDTTVDRQLSMDENGFSVEEINTTVDEAEFDQ